MSTHYNQFNNNNIGFAFGNGQVDPIKIYYPRTEIEADQISNNISNSDPTKSPTKSPKTTFNAPYPSPMTGLYI